MNVTESAQGIETLTERIYYDSELRGYLREIGGEVTLTGDVFRFIQNRFKTDFDNPIPASLSVYNPHSQTYETVFNGVVFPADCEFDLYANSVVCQLVDSTFFAKIENNKNLKFTINAGLSKLGVDISSRGGEIDYGNITQLWANPAASALPFAPQTSVTPITGIFTTAITLYQALDYLVAAMTDGDVQFFSTYLADDPTHPNYVIMSGEQVRMVDPLIARRPYVSWAELFGDLSKQFNLLMAVEELSVGVYRLRVEPFDFWKQQSVTDLTQIKPRVKERVDIEMLPSSVLVGSAKVEKKLAIPSDDMYAKDPFSAVWVPPNTVDYFDFVPVTPFIYHWQEEYNYAYQSNVDSPQVLRHSVLITDTKLYQYQVSQYWARLVIPTFDTESDINENYDEDVFLISSTEEKTYPSGFVARRPIIYAEPFFYIINRDINNINTMQRNLSSVPASASLLYSQFAGQKFRAFYQSTGSWQSFVSTGNTYHLVAISYLVGATVTNEGDWIANIPYEEAQLTLSTNPGIIMPTPSDLITNGYLSIVAGFNLTTTPGFDNTLAPGYDTTDFYWTAGITALYSFRVFLKYAIRGRVNLPLTNPNAQWFGLLLVWDSTGTNLKEFRMIGNGTITGYSQTNLTGNQAISQIEGLLDYTTQQPFNLTAGDKVQLVMTTAAPENDGRWGLWITEDSFFEIQGSSLPDQGGTILTNQVGSTFLVENELEGDVPADIWAGIRANPFGRYTYQVSDNGEGRTGFLKDFSREIISGKFNGLTKIRTLTPEDDNRGIITEPIEPDAENPEEEEE